MNQIILAECISGVSEIIDLGTTSPQQINEFSYQAIKYAQTICNSKHFYTLFRFSITSTTKDKFKRFNQIKSNNHTKHLQRLIANKNQRLGDFQTADLHLTNNTNLINNHLIDRFTNFHQIDTAFQC